MILFQVPVTVNGTDPLFGVTLKLKSLQLGVLRVQLNEQEPVQLFPVPLSHCSSLLYPIPVQIIQSPQYPTGALQKSSAQPSSHRHDQARPVEVSCKSREIPVSQRLVGSVPV